MLFSLELKRGAGGLLVRKGADTHTLKKYKALFLPPRVCVCVLGYPKINHVEIYKRYLKIRISKIKKFLLGEMEVNQLPKHTKILKILVLIIVVL